MMKVNIMGYYKKIPNVDIPFVRSYNNTYSELDVTMEMLCRLIANYINIILHWIIVVGSGYSIPRAVGVTPKLWAVIGER